MNSYGMLLCSFFMKQRFKKGNENVYKLNGEYNYIDDVGNQNSYEDFFAIMQAFCKKYEDVADDEKEQKLFSIKKESVSVSETDTYKTMSFIIMSGSYGIEGYIKKRITYETVHVRTRDQAEIQEFVCVVYIPKDIRGVNIEKGMMVFQSIGNYGVKTITTDYIRLFLSSMGLTFETRSVSVRAFMEKLIEQGRLYKITLIRDRVSPNDADNMLISTGREEKSYVNPKPKPEWMNRILRIFDSMDETGVYELPDDNQFDDISIQFKIGNRMRTVRLKRLERLSIVEDIPDIIVRESDLKKIIDYMIQTADTYTEKMVFTVSRGV